MSSPEHRSPDETEPVSPRTASARADGQAWTVVSYLLGGPIFWGTVGWLIDLMVGTEKVFLPIGLVLGMGAALYLVWVRYGRS